MLCQWQVGAIALDALLLGLQGWKLMACRVIRCPKGHRFLFPFGFHKNFRFFFIHSLSIWIPFPLHLRDSSWHNPAHLGHLKLSPQNREGPSSSVHGETEKKQLSFGHQPQRRVSQRFIQIQIFVTLDENGAF